MKKSKVRTKPASKERRYVTYKILSQALTRDKVACPGKQATFLLDAFTKRNGKIYKAQLVKANIITNEDGQFVDWRVNMVELGWLVYEYSNKYSRYYPGDKLTKYINKEKMELFEIATTRQVNEANDETRDRLQKVEQKLEAVMRGFIEKINPPDTEEKRRAYIAEFMPEYAQ